MAPIFWGVFEINNDKILIFLGDDDWGKVPFIGRIGGAIPIASESRHDTVLWAGYINFLKVKRRESVYRFYLFNSKTQLRVENEGMFAPGG